MLWEAIESPLIRVMKAWTRGQHWCLGEMTGFGMHFGNGAFPVFFHFVRDQSTPLSPLFKDIYSLSSPYRASAIPKVS